MILAAGRYGLSATDGGWWQGDFNYDGRVNSSDISQLLSTGLLNAGTYLPAGGTGLTGAESLRLSAGVWAAFGMIAGPLPDEGQGATGGLTATGQTEQQAPPPMISEFLASNGGVLADEDGEFADWIEIFNPGSMAVSLGGWHLTDNVVNLTKWTFPEVTLEAGGYLVVFASGKDRTDPLATLHTNFSLAAGGEYLGLVRPDGVTVVSAYAPEYPRQFRDVSYGLGEPGSVTEILAGRSDFLRVLVPEDDALGASWTGGESFDDSGWLFGSGGVGYDRELGTSQFYVGINFQPATAPVPEGYLADVGQAFGPHADDFAYGWFRNGTATANLETRRRNAHPDLRYDTINHLQKVTGVSWAIDLPNGEYDVRIVAGDPSHADSVNSFVVGGVLVIDPDGPDRWDEYEVRVSVTDGRLTIRPATEHGASNSKLAFLEIWGVEPAYEPFIRTDLEAAMHGRATSAFVRHEFLVVDPAAYGSLALNVRYDDGFVAYVNGVEVARANAPQSLWHGAAATLDRPDAEAVEFQAFDITSFLPLLVAGSNVLAIHGLNASETSGRFLIQAELAAERTVPAGERYFAQPTPGSANVGGFIGLAAVPDFSVARGFYTEAFDLVLASDQPGAVIRYTLDGSLPTATRGLVYAGPIPIATTTVVRAAAFAPGLFTPGVETHSYMFVADVPGQVAPNHYPTSRGTVPIHYRLADPVTAGWQGNYADRIGPALLALPTLSLVLPMEDYFGPSGIYANPTVRAVERATSAEWILPDGATGFQLDAGLRIQGGASRMVANTPKQSMSLRFRAEYGASSLDYPLFPGSGVTSFDTLQLRGVYNNSWAHWDNQQRLRGTLIQDQWMRDTLHAMGQADAGQGRFAHVYINGLYWGIFNIHERPEESHYAAWNGGDDSRIDAINGGRVVNGTADSWNRMKATVAGGDWTAIRGVLDVDSFIDWTIANRFGNNRDLKADGNWRAVGGGPDDLPWRFYSWDAEHTLYATDTNPPGPVADPPGLLTTLLGVEEFRIRFADRLHLHFFNDGALTTAATVDRYLARAAELDEAIVAESLR
jgi:hypothetical protein